MDYPPNFVIFGYTAGLPPNSVCGWQQGDIHVHLDCFNKQTNKTTEQNENKKKLNY